jgi:hypothetical protein
MSSLQSLVALSILESKAVHLKNQSLKYYTLCNLKKMIGAYLLSTHV